MKNSQWAGSLSLCCRKYLLPLLHGVFKGPVEESKALSDDFADAGDKCDQYYCSLLFSLMAFHSLTFFFSDGLYADDTFLTASGSDLRSNKLMLNLTKTI